jgi:hypothetical protein
MQYPCSRQAPLLLPSLLLLALLLPMLWSSLLLLLNMPHTLLLLLLLLSRLLAHSRACGFASLRVTTASMLPAGAHRHTYVCT